MNFIECHKIRSLNGVWEVNGMVYWGKHVQMMVKYWEFTAAKKCHLAINVKKLHDVRYVCTREFWWKCKLNLYYHGRIYKHQTFCQVYFIIELARKLQFRNSIICTLHLHHFIGSKQNIRYIQKKITTPSHHFIG